MKYDNFDTQKQESLIELHKTDYNNYADLSHFVDEYYKAQALIKECNNFYRSFLKSKLLSYSKLTNSVHSQDKYKFYTYEITDGINSFVNFVDEYPNITKLYNCSDLSQHMLDISIRGISYLAAAGASLLTTQKLFSDNNRIFDLSFSFFDKRLVPKNLVLKEDNRICISLYGSLDMQCQNRESEDEYNKRIESAYKKLCVNGKTELKNMIEPIRKKFFLLGNCSIRMKY